MESSTASLREIALPVTVLGALRRELRKEAGSLPAIHVLHAVGYECGVEAVRAFQSAGEPVGDIPEDAFWTRLSAFLAARGWGTVTHQDVHPGVGLVSSADWVESETEEASEEASCSYTTGFLAGLLTELAGGPVAVLEVSCRGRGNERCSFAFGSEHAVHELYGHLIEAEGLDDALARL